jgi:hypothetical protein
MYFQGLVGHYIRAITVKPHGCKSYHSMNIPVMRLGARNCNFVSKLLAITPFFGRRVYLIGRTVDWTIKKAGHRACPDLGNCFRNGDVGVVNCPLSSNLNLEHVQPSKAGIAILVLLS